MAYDRIADLEERVKQLEEGYSEPNLKITALGFAHQVHGLTGMGQSMTPTPEQVVARANAYLEFLNGKKVDV